MSELESSYKNQISDLMDTLKNIKEKLTDKEVIFSTVFYTG